ncbi:hypothetical protein [Sphingomonas aerolata]|uniref:hypothetical protein n=1 Tax=Sphingomonas aerolata TaxID=185951 RepID=UPI002FDFE031
MSDETDAWVDQIFGRGGVEAPRAIQIAPQPRIRAVVTNDVTDYPHNDLENAAYFFRERLKKSIAERDRAEGIFLDMIALVTMTSFALEGYVNALGHHRLKDDAKAWKSFEWMPVRKKIETLVSWYGLTIDWESRPFAIVDPLVRLRNLFAHPKATPAQNREQILVGTHNEFVKLLREHKPEYERTLTWEFANGAYEDVDSIWQKLLGASGINPFDVRSGGSQGFEYIEHVGSNNEDEVTS